LLLHTWSGCGGLLNGLAVADVNRCRWGEPPYCAWSRCSSINDTACSSAAVLLPPLGAAQQKMLVRAGLWAAVCGPDGVWPCGGVWPREMRVEGRRRSRCCVVAIGIVAVKSITFWCCINSATCDPLTNSLIPFWHGLKSGSPTPLHNPLSGS
jgi:hypothetical protein